MKIIILPGWRHNSALWQNLTAKLGHDAIALDLPGFGKEPLVKEDWGIPDYALWVVGKISKYKDVILIGHSFGGRVAVEITAQRQKNIRGLILSGTPSLYRPALSTQIKIRAYKLLKNLIPKSFRKLFYSDDLRKAGNLEKIFRRVVRHDQALELKKITLPTLLIWGKKDTEVPLRIAKEMGEILPNSKLKVIEDAGHNAFLESPNLFYGYVKDYISHL